MRFKVFLRSGETREVEGERELTKLLDACPGCKGGHLAGTEYPMHVDGYLSGMLYGDVTMRKFEVGTSVVLHTPRLGERARVYDYEGDGLVTVETKDGLEVWPEAWMQAEQDFISINQR